MVDCIPVTVLGNISVLYTRLEHTEGHWPACEHRTAYQTGRCFCTNIQGM